MNVANGNPAGRAMPRLAGKAIAFVVVAVVAVLAWRYGGPPPPKAQFAFERPSVAGFERLTETGKLNPGDRLSLVARSAEPVYVYVVNEDAAGVVSLLFPFTSLDRTNPLPEGDDVRLPGTQSGQPFSWQVTSTAGTERFLLLARAQEMTELPAHVRTLADAAAAQPRSELPAPASGLRERLFPDGVPSDVYAEELAFEIQAPPSG